MKAKKFNYILIILLFWSYSCSKTVDPGERGVSELIPIALKGEVSPPVIEIPQTPVEEGSSSQKSNTSSPGIPADFGVKEPEAVFLFDTSAVNRYNNLQIRFSESMDISSVEKVIKLLDKNGTEVLDSNGNPGFALYWDSPLDLIMDPRKELNVRETYSISISDSAKTFKGKALKPFLGSFTTESTFIMTHKIKSSSFPSGIDINKESGVLLDKSNDSFLVIESTINEPETIASIKLCKLGNLSETSGTIICRAEVARGIEICNSNCTGTLTFNLSSSVIKPQDGANNYFYQIESKSGKKYYRTVNFDYGNIADPNLEAVNAATVVLDRQLDASRASKSTASALSGLIKSYGKGEFVLDSKSLNQFITGSTANSPPGTDLSGKTCLSWGTKPAFNYLSKIGPFCDIQVSGTIFVSSSYPSVKYAAKADVYITDVKIDEVAQPGDVDNVSIDIVTENGYVDIFLNGKKASGKMALVAKLPDTLNTTGNLVSGSNQLSSLASTTGLINGMVVTGTGIPAGTTISSMNGNTLTLSQNATQSGTGVSIKFEGIEFFTYLVGDTFVFYGNSVSGYDGDAVSFSLNNDPPSLSPRLARAKTSLSVLSGAEAGNLKISVSPATFLPSVPTSLNGINFNKCATGFHPEECNPQTIEWSDNIATGAVVGSGAVAAIIADVVNQKIEEVKPRVVQGVVKDIAERVAPDIVNNIIGQLKNGISVTLPDYLPAPLNRVSITIKAKLNSASSINDGTHSGLEANANASIMACVKDVAGKCPGEAGYNNPDVPPTLRGNNAYIITKGSASLPSIYNRSAENPGVLLSIHADAVNQAFYHLWKGGALNFSIDKTFIDTINGFAGESGLLKLTESLLKADPITTVFAPGRDKLESGGERIYKSDEVVLKVNPVLLPFVGIVPLSGNAGESEVPKVKLNLADMGIDIYGKKTDVSRTRSISADMVSGSNTVTVFSSSGLAKDMIVCGNGIAANTKLNSINGNVLTLSNAATSSLSSESLKFVDGGRVLTANVTAGNTGLNLTEACGIEAGMLVSGNGINKGSTVQSVSGNSIVLSAAPTSSGTAVELKFYREYLIARVMVSLSTKAELTFGTYNLPAVTPANFNPSSSLLASVGNTSIQLKISDAAGDLFYIVEPLEGSSNNPLGLNPDGIWEVMDPLVKSLVLPLLNNVTKDIPLPRMRSCGLELKNLKTLAIPSTSSMPYMLLNAEVGNYTFTGNCQL
ncbi:MAG: Ig-like domain-containing protein [Leptospiraceae bacterium]|nr:Ig-like domain-containing protein [Leptospiraceae bacterium]